MVSFNNVWVPLTQPQVQNRHAFGYCTELVFPGVDPKSSVVEYGSDSFRDPAFFQVKITGNGNIIYEAGIHEGKLFA